MRTICEFWKIRVVKRKKSKQRIVRDIFVVLLSATTWGALCFFSIIFEILWQWKVEGCLFAEFVGYYLEGLLISRAKFSEKVSND